MRPVAVALAALALAPAAAAALPENGVVAPGTSLGGVRLGATKQAVRARWGASFGICRGCSATTWYFNYVAFQPQGAGVVFRDGRADALFTLWQPPGWHTTEGVKVGDAVASVTTAYGALDRRDCNGYYALILRRPGAVTEFYVVDEHVWGFGVSRVPQPCR